MNSAIVTTQNAAIKRAAIVPAGAEKDVLSQLSKYAVWLDQTGRKWNNPDLATYRDYLLSIPGANGKPLSAVSVAAHLSTVRGRYQSIIDRNETRDYLYSLTPSNASPVDRKSFVDEGITRIQNGIKPSGSTVPVIEERDIDDSKHVRLTRSEAESLMQAPFYHRANTPLQAAREGAMIALMLCTSIREMELCALTVADLRM